MSKLRVSRKGARSGGQSFSRGALYELLSNPIYIGEVRHRKERHPGKDRPILDRRLWEKVQGRLREYAARPLRRPTKAPLSPLAGKLLNESGKPLYACGAAKGSAQVPVLLYQESWSGVRRVRCKVPGSVF